MLQQFIGQGLRGELLQLLLAGGHPAAQGR